jgi:translation initiation factor IF-2
MEKRRLRLGDILDDYCPRERRITNHAVVAMIDDEVKQTRCTTCDADHEYKQAKVPPARRKKLDGAALGDGAEAMLRRPEPEPEPDAEAIDIAEVAETEPLEAEPVEAEPVEVSPAQEPVDGVVIADESPAPAAVEEPSSEEPLAASGEDDGPVHRRLIRATLPRPEGQVPERKLPDFTIRQPGGRGGRGEFDGNRNGQRPGRGGGGGRPMRFSSGGGGGAGKGPRHGAGQGPGQRSGGGNRTGGGHPQRGGHGRGGGGRKRGR